MDHEVVPRPCKISDWLFNSSRDHLCLHQGEKPELPWSLRSPKDMFLRPTLSINMVQWVLRWERQKRRSSRKKVGKLCYNWIWNEHFLGKRKWRQHKTREWPNLIFFFLFFPKMPFVEFKKAAHWLYSAWSFLLVHIWFTPSEGPRAL